METSVTNEPIVLFDGDCNLCDSSVQFIIDRDPSAQFKFASLQSEVGSKLLAEGGVTQGNFSTVVLYDNGRFYTKSSAALRIATKLSYPWKLAALLLIVPPPARNVVYDFVSRNRYRWFGKMEACRVPTPELRARFLS